MTVIGNHGDLKFTMRTRHREQSFLHEMRVNPFDGVAMWDTGVPLLLWMWTMMGMIP